MLRFNANFTELQMVAFNVAVAAYLMAQTKLNYGEVPPFFTTLTHIAPPVVWIALMLLPVVGTLWARHIDCHQWRWRFSWLSAVVWLFLTSFLWTSFVWASGKISVVHFFAPVVLSTALFYNVRLGADRRIYSRDKSPEIVDDGESLIDCIRRGCSQHVAPAVMFAVAYLRWR